ncbi:hypothetical protein [Desulfuromonas sp.]|uniref:hypothetical protein n=1 Tax=Desulfuromonas sp. TaxID=892 RepID=UPI0025C73C86|nr:hypothetical protein [Desulfuromonas sp.]
MKQPLSYQTLPCSCWVTTVINGLLFLYGDKNKIPSLVLRLLHTVLTDDGVDNCNSSKADWEIVLEAVSKKCNMEIKTYKKEAVQENVKKTDFRNYIVICDISAGTHTILLTSRSGDWYFGFDPDWDQSRGMNKENTEYEFFPQVKKNLEGRINFRVHKDHLFNMKSTKNRVLSMGAVSQRSISIISKTIIKRANENSKSTDGTEALPE